MEYNTATEYNQPINAQKVAATAPDHVIHLLLQGVIDRIEQAKGWISVNKPTKKSECINRTIGIINGLRVSLHYNGGVEIANQLEQRYDFIIRHLTKANNDNSIFHLEEVVGLIKTIKSSCTHTPQTKPYLEPSSPF